MFMIMGKMEEGSKCKECGKEMKTGVILPGGDFCFDCIDKRKETTGSILKEDKKLWESGYYWLKFKPKHNQDDEWIVGLLSGGTHPWQIVGSDEVFTGEEFEIGDKIERVKAMIKADNSVMTKGQLIDMDDRFLNWLSDADGDKDIKEAQKHRYITISETEDDEVDISGCDSLEKLREECSDTLEESESGWRLTAIFDLENAKELKFKEVIRVDIEGIDF